MGSEDSVSSRRLLLNLDPLLRHYVCVGVCGKGSSVPDVSQRQLGSGVWLLASKANVSGHSRRAPGSSGEWSCGPLGPCPVSTAGWPSQMCKASPLYIGNLLSGLCHIREPHVSKRKAGPGPWALQPVPPWDLAVRCCLEFTPASTSHSPTIVYAGNRALTAWLARIQGGRAHSSDSHAERGCFSVD